MVLLPAASGSDVTGEPHAPPVEEKTNPAEGAAFSDTVTAPLVAGFPNASCRCTWRALPEHDPACWITAAVMNANAAPGPAVIVSPRESPLSPGEATFTVNAPASVLLNQKLTVVEL